MPNHYVEDYEALTGNKPEAAETEVKAKVISTDKDAKPESDTTAETKSGGN